MTYKVSKKQNTYRVINTETQTVARRFKSRKEADRYISEQTSGSR